MAPTPSNAQIAPSADEPHSPSLPQDEIGQLARQAAPGATRPPRSVFLSSTSKDLAAYRRDVHDIVERTYNYPVDMAQFGAGADATTVSLTNLAAADLVVLIVAWRYGFIPEGETRSVTQLEYEHAVKLQKPLFVYLADPATKADDGPTALFPADPRDPKYSAQLDAFRALLEDSNAVTREYFDTPDNLSKKVVAALARWLHLHPDPAPAPLLHPDASGRVVALADMPVHGLLIGRDSELADLTQRLTAGEDMCVFAIEGMGGVGKTALAATAVERFSDAATDTGAAFPGGVIWLACAGHSGDVGLLALLTQVARLIGRGDLAAHTDLAALRWDLAAALRTRSRTLLALDNIEPTMDAELALQTLSTPGHTTLLLTARDQVTPDLVTAIRLAPLPTPDATRLFAQRLGQATNRARPTTAEEPDIPALVEAVGGLPLAVELLAAHAGLQKTELAALRDELATAGINADAFHANPKRTLTKTFDRSWETLAAQQKRLFAGLSLLAEVGFPRAAAAALAMAAGQRRRPASAPLVAQHPDAEQTSAAEARAERAASESVVSLVRAALVEPLGGERLRLHPLLRAYARERLSQLGAATQDSCGNAMLAYWLTYAQSHPSQDGQDPAAMDAQEAEAHGLMGALAWAQTHGSWLALLALTHMINWTWFVRGRRTEERMFRPWAIVAARELGDRRALQYMIHALALLDDQTGQPERARAGYEEALALARDLGEQSAICTELHCLATLDANQGHLQRARASFEEALALARELGDQRAIQQELHSLAALDDQTGQPERARTGYAEALALARELGDKAAIRAELYELATLDAQTGQSERAQAGYKEALDLARELGEKSAIRSGLHGLAVLDARSGQPQRARAGFEEALALARELGDQRAIRLDLHELAVLNTNEGNGQLARAGYEKALAFARALGDVAAQAIELCNMGVNDRVLGDLPRARDELTQALALAQQIENAFWIARALNCLGYLARDEGDTEAACATFRDALARFERLGSPEAEEPRAMLRVLGCQP
jgi:tetratricopeptide (TPR) repeat protein